MCRPSRSSSRLWNSLIGPVVEAFRARLRVCCTPVPGRSSRTNTLLSAMTGRYARTRGPSPPRLRAPGTARSLRQRSRTHTDLRRKWGRCSRCGRPLIVERPEDGEEIRDTSYDRHFFGRDWTRRPSTFHADAGWRLSGVCGDVGTEVVQMVGNRLLALVWIPVRYGAQDGRVLTHGLAAHLGREIEVMDGLGGVVQCRDE